MNTFKRNIPNLITLSNLVFGIFSIIMSFNGKLIYSGLFIFAGSFLDFFDGFTARLLNVNSEIGKQLDSFADMITFGLAPGIIMYHLIILQPFKYQYYFGDFFEISYIAFLIPIFSSIRLAKFNIDTRQSSSFIGLPTPASAIFIASLPIIINNYNTEFSIELLLSITATLSVLLVSELPLFSLKIKSKEQIKSTKNIIRLLFLIKSIILLFIFHIAAIPFIVILYIFLSILNNLLK
tara:strand:- start:147 stop:857 length:711 start_codon:yes stop_codon:yes gene_type:complete